ncbi:MAG: 3-hydroxyacyl-ACP dehydratase FabZ [Chitinispirillales bacterium]|jgi:beta-hydroxyacyl-ACP dehydratase FabZ|nr:3-hydroxyacyl-ACP dehydratase FabZ [Chitinispirillales bacterium]
MSELFDIKTIMQFVPHRFPFLLIDRIMEFEENKRVVAKKNVSINEAQFQGHFPNEPVFPGVLIVEHMAQAACFLLSKSAGSFDTSKVYYLGKVKNMSFRKPVVPGDTIETEVKIITAVGAMAMVEAASKVDGVLVAKGELAFSAA